MIKTILISDTHGQLPKIEDGFDLLLIAGDVAPNYGHRGVDCEYQRAWMSDEFIRWVMGLPFNDKHSKVVFIAGNHDWWLESESEAYKYGYSSIWTDVIHPCFNRLVYLYDSEYVFEKDGEKLHIYGTPWCKQFFNWAFMLNDEKLKLAYDNIPDGLDILLTHDAPAILPYGIITQGRYSGTDAGNKVLADAVKEKKPRYHFSGHIHSSCHEMMEIDGTCYATVSILDENYQQTYKPLIVEINKKKEKNNE